MISKKVIIGKCKFGKGFFAKKNIKKGEVVLIFEGKLRNLQDLESLPDDVSDHAVQVSENKWLELTDNAKLINHSCEPNCGIKNKVKIIAMKDISKGDEVTFDYNMTEDSGWKMECKCGSKNCRKLIQNHEHLPREFRDKYKGYISDWLVEKYKL